MIRFLAKYRAAGSVTISLNGEQAAWPETTPLVITLTDRVMAHMGEYLPSLASLGYRSVERDHYLRINRYVRPLPLWLCHRAGVAAHRFYRQSVGWLYDHSLISLACDEDMIWRFRDIRPWPFSKRYRGRAG